MAQQYENYWKITLEYSNIFGEKFKKCLAIIVFFIDKEQDTPFSEEKYERLQKLIESVFPKKDSASTRKSINQYVKLGFIRPELVSYHPATKTFLKETDTEKIRALFSKVVYSGSSFESSVTKFSNKREINFLIRTLQKVGTLSKTGVLALMTIDITKYPQGYLSVEELEKACHFAEAIDFKERKYNQLGHFWSILQNLKGILVQDGEITQEEALADTDEATSQSKNRDPYLQQIYKMQLAEESSKQYGDPSCMVEQLPYPALIASHIKPFRESSEEEAYDPNNGILLSRNIDGLFDKGLVSFTEDGVIVVSPRVPKRLKEHLKNFSLDKVFLTPQRVAYLKYHRKEVFLRDSAQ